MSRRRNIDNSANEEKIDALYDYHRRFVLKLVSICLIALIALALLWVPVMKPWIQERAGLAKLRQAEYENKIQAEQSAAERDAAELRAQAIAIVGAVAQAYPEYRSQEFIGGFAEAMRAGEVKQTFYIPTASSVPILPAMANPARVLAPGLTTEQAAAPDEAVNPG